MANVDSECSGLGPDAHCAPSKQHNASHNNAGLGLRNEVAVKKVMPKPTTLRLVRATDASRDVRVLVLEVVSNEVFSFQPGQWMALRRNEGTDAYLSIASAPDQLGPNCIELAVRAAVDRDHAWLRDLGPGSLVQAWGPSGTFTRNSSHLPCAAFIGTGTGLAPLRSMLHAEYRLHSMFVAPVVLLAGHRNEESTLWRREFELLAQADPHFDYWLTLSNPSSAWRGRTGRVQAYVQAVVERIAPQEYYLCGQPGMVEEVRALLTGAYGIAPECIHTEQMSAQTGMVSDRAGQQGEF